MTLNLCRNARLLIVAAVSAAAVATATTVYVIACGGPIYDLVTVNVVHPAEVERFEKGDVGVVRPRLARRYLAQAYRSFSGRPPLVVAAPPKSTPATNRPDPFEEWIGARDRVLGTTRSADEAFASLVQFRYVGNDYQAIWNCPDDAFTTAVKTLAARQARFGEGSAELRDWTRAQAVVFSNCPGPPARSNPQPGGREPLFLPEPAPSGVDALIRADRAYQTAAAYFYGLQYEEAARRFREIAADATSPWRSYGQYLAARATIRMATVNATNDAERDRLFGTAQDELKRVLADASASALHESARGLIDFIEARLRIVERLHRVSDVLATGTSATEQDFADYRWMMDRLIGDTIDYDYVNVRRRDEVIANDELNDWVLAVQGQGTAAAERAIARWRATRTPVWLVAALWRAYPQSPAAAEIVDAARTIDRSSPAYSTVAFLRVRLLTALGRRDEARALLATLPNGPEPGFQAETINLLKAERFLLADNLGELLTHATRTTVFEQPTELRELPGLPTVRTGKPYSQPVFDADAGALFSRRMPLDRLVEAAVSPTLPDRLRVRVAMAAFTRAVLLRRDEAGLRVAAILRQLAPPMAADLDRYTKAANADNRHFAALLLLMRTPGLHADVRGADDENTIDDEEPMRAFNHVGGNWWCAFEEPTFNNSWQGVPEVINLLYPTKQVAYPAFITAAERATTEQELKALGTAGAARSYLAAEVLLWARARPKDPDVPEALALIVEGWRWNASCFGESDNWQLAQRAFQTLHARYPDSVWAQRTKYWYK